ncbi:EamA family transporter [Rugosimonospora africana]|uniref:Multidrug transporter n=1 Tax=Rugosimonospora africana TaxID=556532 RepID=A0A8J3QW33_9ACTN|nr:EamA family transporter [Rugosimonospora africana]GIH15816.1 multidrug transporter [Rugosimonospora africana]
MGTVLGLAAALLYGGSDFAGGLAARRLGSLPVNLVGTAASVLIAWAALGMFAGPGPSVHAVAWGLASGLGGGAGTLTLYRGLARGQMSVVGPVSAVAAAALPVAAGIAMGERPPLPALVGIAVSLPAIVLVTTNGRGKGIARTALLDGLGAGAAFGVMFIGLAQAGAGSGLWPVASEQTGSLVLVLAVAAKTRAPLRAAIRAPGWPVLVGASGMAATLLYFYATHSSMLSTTVVLVSLYPAVTVLLARMVLHERFNGAQRAGLVLSTLAVIAIALD